MTGVLLRRALFTRGSLQTWLVNFLQVDAFPRVFTETMGAKGRYPPDIASQRSIQRSFHEPVRSWPCRETRAGPARPLRRIRRDYSEEDVARLSGSIRL